MNKLFRSWVITLLYLGVVSCGSDYKDPEIAAIMFDRKVKPGTHILAVATQYQKMQWPRNSFPGIGIPKILEQEVRIYFCDADNPENIRLVSLVVDPHVYKQAQPSLLGWDGEVLYFRVEAFEDEHNTKRLYLFYRWDEKNGLTPMPAAPTPSLQWGAGKSGVFLEHNYRFESNDASTDRIALIDVKTDRSPEWKKGLFQLDPASGDIISILK